MSRLRAKQNRETAASEPPLLLAGSDFDGRYRIDTMLGAGGIGVVYRATDVRLDRPVAVKVLRDVYGALRSQRRRFSREGRALAQLLHPNIVTVLDFGVASDTPYLVMELLEGESLGQLLQRKAPLPPDEAFAIMRQLLSGLAYMHGQGVVHRDLKPDNVFLQTIAEGKQHVKLLDFGLAKFLDVERLPTDDTAKLTRSGEMFGTPGYMPPEQIIGQADNPRVDVYSAAVILFEMLAGSRPFWGATLTEVVRLQLEGSVPPLSRICRERSASAALSALFDRALACDPAVRFPDARALEAALLALPNPCVYEGTGAADAKARSAAEAATVRATPALGWRDTGLFAGLVAAVRTLIRRIMLAGAFVVSFASLAVLVAAAGVIYIFTTPGKEAEQRALRQVLPENITEPFATKRSARPQPRPVAAAPQQAPEVKAPAAAMARAPREGAPPSDVPHDDAPHGAAPSAPSPEQGSPERPGPVAPVAGAVAPTRDGENAPATAAQAQGDDALAAPEPALDPETPAVAADPALSRPAARNPWRAAAPRALRNVRRGVLRGWRGSRRTVNYLRRYNRAHPNDGRGNLLLAGLYMNRSWVDDALKQYAWAVQRDPSLRGDPRILADVLDLADTAHSRIWRDAAAFVRQAYGAEASARVAQAAADARAEGARRRLSLLSQQLSSE